jgi:Tfp pilus assembly protein PilF
LPTAAQQGGIGAPGGRGRFSITGTLRDPQSNEGLEGVLIELHQFNGPVVNQAFTSQNGSFSFPGLVPDTYDLVVNRDGFERIDEQITMTNNVASIELQLRRAQPEFLVPGGTVVSARELSIPKRAHEDMQKGMSLLNQKSDYPGSVAQFQKAIKEYPDYYEAYTQIGVAYMSMNDAARSEDALHKSVEVSKERYVDAFFVLATLYNNKERFAEAEEQARKGVALSANSWQSQFQLGRALYGLGRFADAEEAATAAKTLQPDNPEIYLLLANVHGKTRNFAKLVEDLSNYLKLAPNGPQAAQARETRAQILQSLGDRQANGNAPSQ